MLLEISMLNPFAYPTFVLWAARLIRHKHPESLGVIKRVIRSRLMLGTQMSEVETDIYEWGLSGSIIVSLASIPFTLILFFGLVYGPIFNPSVVTMDDYLFVLAVMIICASIVMLPIYLLGIPILGRNAAKKHKIHPQPFETLTDRLASRQVFRYYLRHIKKHRKWNPLYLLFAYFAALGTHFYGKSGEKNYKDGSFNAYNALRAIFPLAYFVVFISIIFVFLESRFSAGVFFFSVIGLFALAILHSALGRAHGDIPLNFNASRPNEITRAQFAKAAVYGALGTFVGVNFDKIRTWVTSLL
jgi:hypothetical protein